jgi:hypothetical protein
MMQVSNRGDGVSVYTKTEDFYPIPLGWLRIVLWMH